jgi:hypothetical protein
MKLLTLIMVCLFLNCGFSLKEKHKKNDLEQYGYRGTVKSVRMIDYLVEDKFGELIKTIKTIDLYVLFNSKGYRIQSIVYPNDIELNKPVSTEIHKYDDKEQMVETITLKPDSSLKIRTIYKYDNNGNKIEECWFDPDGSVSMKYFFIYGNNRNKSEERWCRADSSIVCKYIFKYDEKDNLIESDCVQPNGSLKSKKICKYDNNGNLLEENYIKPEGNLEIRYDNKGNMIERKSHKSDGSILEDCFFKNDNRGNEIEANWLISKNSFKYTYKYDVRGNWIQKITFVNGTQKASTERIIEYFDQSK